MGQTQRVTGVATSIYQDRGYTTIRYHATAVVQFNDKEILLNTGGWRTNTTKARMNQASNQFGLGYCVEQKDFAWFVRFKGETYSFSEDQMTLIR